MLGSNLWYIATCVGATNRIHRVFVSLGVPSYKLSYHQIRLCSKHIEMVKEKKNRNNLNRMASNCLFTE